MITTINDWKIYESLSKEDQEFISKKIKILTDEGYPHKQAIAIAYSYLDKKEK